MTTIQEYKRGWRDGVRFAVTWLHERANEMNDPSAKAAINVAASDLGRKGKESVLTVERVIGPDVAEPERLR